MAENIIPCLDFQSIPVVIDWTCARDNFNTLLKIWQILTVLQILPHNSK